MPTIHPLKTFGRAARRLWGAMVCAAALSAATATGAVAAPSLDEAVEFARSEIGRLCSDETLSRLEAIDTLSVGVGRSCQVRLAPGLLDLNVRRRGEAVVKNGHRRSGGYARMNLAVNFHRDSGFFCGRANTKGRATLFVSCDVARGVEGTACAERRLSVTHAKGELYEAVQSLPAAAIMQTDVGSCSVLSRALEFISERSRAPQRESMKDYFARR